MPTSWKFYHDAGLTQEIASGNTLAATQDGGISFGPVTKTIYFGSNNSASKAQVTANPGIDPVIVSIDDAAGGSGAPATEFKLALSAGGLSSAVAGASLSLSATLTGGVANAVPIYTQRSSALTVVGDYTDISLVSNHLTETPL